MKEIPLKNVSKILCVKLYGIPYLATTLNGTS